MAGNVLLEGLLYGRLPIVGKKDWLLYYVALNDKQFVIYEGNESPNRQRKHLQSLELHCSDRTGVEGKDKKSDFKFVYDRGSGGRYVFKCQRAEQRQDWIMTLEKLIQKREYIDKGILSEDASNSFTTSLPTSPSLVPVTTPTPPPRTTTLPSNYHMTTHETPPTPPPHQNRPIPVQKRDSGFISGTATISQQGYRGTSADGEIFHTKSNSGDSAVVHNTAVRLTDKSNSADGSFMQNQPRPLEEEDLEEDLARYEWYWGEMSRETCGKELTEKGSIGNFIVRKNDRGDFVMSFWRKDGVHHHRILRQRNIFKFERSAVDAQGESIPDLLDTYMKHCTDKTIGPYGGQLYPTYDQAWNPPDIDFKKFANVLNKKAEESGPKRLFKPGYEMANNTYGGMSLHQIKDVIENNQTPPSTPPISETPEQHHHQLNPFGGYKPPGTPTNKVKQPIKATSPGPKTKPGTKPKPKKSPVHSSRPLSGGPPAGGYVNLTTKIPSYENTKRRISREEEEEEFDEDDQEVYIAPGELEDEEEEQPIYENHGPGGSQPEPCHYVNTQLQANGSESDGGGLYQNVSFDGKPFTPPRQIKPSPRLKHHQK